MKGFADVLFIVFLAGLVMFGGIILIKYFSDAITTVTNAFVNITETEFGNKSAEYNATVSVKSGMDAFFSSGDFLIASLFFGSIIFILLSALLVRFSPLFLPAYVVFTLVATWMAIFLRDSFRGMLSTLPWLADYPISSNIMLYLPIIVGVLGGLIIIIQYALRTEVI